MKYRHKKSGKIYSADEMSKMRGRSDYSDDDYEQYDDDAEKSDVSEDELRKSMDELDSIIAGGDRKSELLAKAQAGEMDDDERDELIRLMKGDHEDGLSSDVTAPVLPDASEDLEKALDVSHYLRELHGGLVSGLEQLCEHIEKSDRRQHEFDVVLAKALRTSMKRQEELEGLVKSMAEKIGVLERQPARPRKSSLTKSDVAERNLGGSGGDEPNQTKMQKSNVRGVLMNWLEGGKQVSGSGEAIGHAIVKFESSNQISKGLLQEVEAEWNKQRGAA